MSININRNPSNFFLQLRGAIYTLSIYASNETDGAVAHSDKLSSIVSTTNEILGSDSI